MTSCECAMISLNGYFASVVQGLMFTVKVTGTVARLYKTVTQHLHGCLHEVPSHGGEEEGSFYLEDGLRDQGGADSDSASSQDHKTPSFRPCLLNITQTQAERES